jgi:REP element-mobilizing transposase RayT
MPNYRRAFIPGGCFFFTVNLLDRRQTLLVDKIAGLREAVATTRRGHPFTIDAFVVLPDHLHTVWTLPPGDTDFSTRWRLIKNRFAKALPRHARSLRLERGGLRPSGRAWRGPGGLQSALLASLPIFFVDDSALAPSLTDEFIHPGKRH